MAKKRKWLKCIECRQPGGAFAITPKGPIHHKCRNVKVRRDDATDPFKFTANHLTPDGSPVEVQGLAHLRRLEKEMGVVSVTANYDHFSEPLPGGKEQFRDRGIR